MQTELAEAHRLHEKIVANTNRLMDAVLAEVYPTTEEKLPDGSENDFDARCLRYQSDPSA